MTAVLSAPLTVQFVCSVLWDPSFMSGYSYLQGHQKHQFPCHVHADPENRKVKEAYFTSHREFKQHCSVISGRKNNFSCTEPDYITVFKIPQYKTDLAMKSSKIRFVTGQGRPDQGMSETGVMLESVRIMQRAIRVRAANTLWTLESSS